MDIQEASRLRDAIRSAQRTAIETGCAQSVYSYPLDGEWTYSYRVENGPMQPGDVHILRVGTSGRIG